MTANPIFCALDTTDRVEAHSLATRLAPFVGGIKLGLEFFTAQGPEGVRAVMQGHDLPLFLDLKLHDIPNTIAGAVRAILPLAPDFTTLHAAGGKAMLQAAVSAVAASAARTRILAVTLLTSLTAADLADLGVRGDVRDQVRRLADLALAAGCDGLVCSPLEVADLRAHLGSAMILMVPGIRPRGSVTDDQSRILTPRAALAAGADHLVIGRPITAAADPAAAARAILASMAGE